METIKKITDKLSVCKARLDDIEKANEEDEITKSHILAALKLATEESVLAAVDVLTKIETNDLMLGWIVNGLAEIFLALHVNNSFVKTTTNNQLLNNGDWVKSN